ncbi:glycosyltransferase [Pedobacter sp. ISL-68]|uniref:glycosyltransferase n=1 Tax=unclassified Pedobacter TaxID=2628915 RepID=UPI001BE586BF|nr:MULTISPECIES: glycosyltransferase [unclassified Pedobacter]MBT2562806.1 glycosyltransferase [Pedobacter sp. ISL-64]MBT2593319.1 glycosyltransferase [Pedobacter sp. ISL-68]
MITPATIYFSSTIIPLKDGGGGSVVIYRHLKRLQKEGHHIVFLNCSPNHGVRTEFTQINIQKRWWHPPLRKYTPLLSTFRFWLHYRFLKNRLTFQKGDKILGILEDTGSLLAQIIASQTKLPYYLFFHDDNIFSKYFEGHLFSLGNLKNIIHHCKHFFVVSKPMQELLKQNCGENAIVIYPIPEGSSRKKGLAKVNFKGLQLCYAGTILPFHDQLIKKIFKAAQSMNGQLTLVTNSDLSIANRFRDCEGIKIRRPLEKLHDLFTVLLEEMDVLLIFYSFNLAEEIRATHSFPSKLTEFCHLGIPILIIAPEESAIGLWAKEHKWQCYVNNDSMDEISEMISRLQFPDFWEKCSRQSIQLAENEFNPANIHQQLSLILNE